MVRFGQVCINKSLLCIHSQQECVTFDLNSAYIKDAVFVYKILTVKFVFYNVVLVTLKKKSMNTNSAFTKKDL